MLSTFRCPGTFLILVMLAAALGPIAPCAGQVSSLITGEKKQAEGEFATQRIIDNRVKDPADPPEWIQRLFFGQYKSDLIELAQQAYRDTGIWFYAKSPVPRKKSCEGYTFAVYGRLLHFMDITELPNYSPENVQKAVAFWQSWQNREDGRFYNPRYHNPKNPKEIRQWNENFRPVNQKYVPSILKLLAAEPVYPYCTVAAQNSSKGKVNLKAFWEEYISKRNGNAGGAAIAEMAWNIDKGEVEYLPHIEAGMAVWIRMLDPETGLLTRGGRWSAYPTTANSFKLLRRLVSYLGLENLPEGTVHRLVDHLIAHEPEFRVAYQGVVRNMTELSIIMMQVTDYRHDDLLAALGNLSEGFHRPENFQVTDKKKMQNASYTGYGIAMIGPYLHWKGMPPERSPYAAPLMSQGAELKHRYVVGPYGNWVNAIEKKPEEILGHPDYSYEKYGV